MNVRQLGMPTLVLVFSVLVPVPAHSGAQKYTHPDFNAIAASHEVLAILPFKVTIDTKRMKDVSLEQVAKMESDEAVEFQRQIYSRFLEKSGKLQYGITFQDIDETNALLLKAGIPSDSLMKYTRAELAEVLGVHALLSGTVNQSQPTSQGMALAQSLLVGIHGSTQRVDIHVTVHDGAQGTLLWSYDHTDSGGGLTGSMANAVEAMTKSLFKKVAGSFPYQAKKRGGVASGSD